MSRSQNFNLGLNFQQTARSNSNTNTNTNTASNFPKPPPVVGGDQAAATNISIKHVTPELAAQVVKHFVLPMFDTDHKRGLRRKYGRL